MKIHAKSLIIVLSAVALFSCSQKNKHQNAGIESIVIDLSDKSLIADKAAYTDYHYIKLETTDESLLTDASRVVCADDRIFVVSFMEPTVFIFDSTGQFLSKISQGQGPGEVICVTDIAVKDEKLYVLDMYKTLKEYDLDGNYIRQEAKFEHNYFSFSFTDNGLLLADCNMNAQLDYNLVFKPENGDNRFYLEKKEWSKGFVVGTTNLVTENYLTWALSDTVYHVNSKNGEVVPAFYIDFKGKGISGYKEDQPLSSYDIYNKDTYALFVNNFIPTASGCFFSFRCKGMYYVRKENNSVTVYTEMVDNLPKLGGAAGYTDKSLLFSLSAHKLLEYRESLTADDLSLPEIYREEISDTDNPLLVFVPVK